MASDAGQPAALIERLLRVDDLDDPSGYNQLLIGRSDVFQSVLALSPADQCEAVRLAATAMGQIDMESVLHWDTGSVEFHRVVRIEVLLNTLLECELPFTPAQFDVICTFMLESHVYVYGGQPQACFPRVVQRYLKSGAEMTGKQVARIREICDAWVAFGEPRYRKWAGKLESLIDDGSAPAVRIQRNGEAFATALLDAIEGMDAAGQAAWAHLLAHAADCSAGKPSKGWMKTGTAHIEAVGEDEFVSHLTNWLSLVNTPASGERTGPWGQLLDPRMFIDPHLDALKGLAWLAGLVDHDELTRAVGAAGISAYKKIPGVGARATRVGNACVWALGNIGSESALANLALMKVKVKFGTAQKGIEKALGKLAESMGVTTAELEEMSVPTYGLTEVGRLEETMGDFTAVLEITDGKPVLGFLKADGTPQKSVPAAVKADFADDLKDIRGRAKDLQKMLSAQKERLDSMFLLRKSWPLELWRERYLDHPLVGVLARRLIWTIRSESADLDTQAIWYDGGLRSLAAPLGELPADTVVALWHPIESDTATIVRWRHWLFEHLVQQPFKQAHREIYLLTDAERSTDTYSNRFASHVLKQHQFNSLCAVRGWKNRLRMMVDDEYPPASKDLPEWDIRAEFWIEGMGDDYNEDYVVESGAFRYLTTDQVRFYRRDAAQATAHASGSGYGAGWRRGALADPIRLEEIPPLVLSEILRDVDLFVGVTSVANDPNWSDGGPGGHHADYWHGYSFGELGESAKVRHDMLTTLIPRLKIATQCRLEPKFLIVEGSVRTYKIHLGSGNILMEPNDQYLCIVKAPTSKKSEDVFLPFAGDGKLAVILSKAFLLAADSKITDPTILSQINSE